MPGKKAEPEASPVSRRATLALRRQGLRSDDAAVSEIGQIMGLVMGYALLVLVASVVFQSIGPKTTEICDDPGNFSTQECSDATDAREFFWIIVIIGGVVVLILVIALARKSVEGGMGGRGGGRSRRR